MTYEDNLFCPICETNYNDVPESCMRCQWQKDNIIYIGEMPIEVKQAQKIEFLKFLLDRERSVKKEYISSSGIIKNDSANLDDRGSNINIGFDISLIQVYNLITASIQNYYKMFLFVLFLTIFIGYLFSYQSNDMYEKYDVQPVFAQKELSLSEMFNNVGLAGQIDNVAWYICQSSTKDEVLFFAEELHNLKLESPKIYEHLANNPYSIVKKAEDKIKKLEKDN